MNTYPIYNTRSNDKLNNFNMYLTQLNFLDTSTEEELGDLEELDDVLNKTGDPLENIKNSNKRNELIKRKKCPILNPEIGNLPNVPNNPLPPPPDLSFLKSLDLPPALVAALFGAYGRGLILAAQNYAAGKIKNELIKMAQGDECVIEIANKLQVGIQTAAQVMYLISQPVVTPVGPAILLPI